MRRKLQRAFSFILLSVSGIFLLLSVTCGKKAAPQPPVPVLPKPSRENRVIQGGDVFLYSFKFPELSTDEKTPSVIAKVEIYRLKLEGVFEEATQIQPQTQTAPQSQTQTAPQSQTQPKAPPPARTISAVEFEDSAEKIAEIPEDQIAGYFRGDSFVITEKINASPGSEDLKYWYYYGAKLFNKKNKPGRYAEFVALHPVVVPKVPASFTATFVEKKITLSWSAVKTDTAGRPLPEGTVVYDIYRGNDANFAPVQAITTTPVTTTSYEDKTFQYGQSYYYFARAGLSTQKREQQSAPSNTILVFPQDIFPPTAPQEVNAVAAREGMVLIWAPNAEDDIAGYNIYRSTQSGADYKKLNTELIRETTFTDPEIQTGQRYYYVVTAVDNAPHPNESKYSSELSEVRRNP